METHEYIPPINIMAERLQRSIYLGTTTDFQGSCKFISLKIGRRITKNQFTPLPMPQSLIKQVKDLSVKEDLDGDLIFTDINGSTLEVYNDDANTHEFTVGVDNNYNNYTSNGASY